MRVKLVLVGILCLVLPLVSCSKEKEDDLQAILVLLALTPTPAASSSTVGVTGNCSINTGTGTHTLSLNGTQFCTVTGLSPVFSGGTGNLTCTSGSMVTLNASCTATNCTIHVSALSGGLDFSAAGLNTGVNLIHTGVQFYTATCP